VLQAETIRRLCEEGVATYDLGSGMDYKARWAEVVFETITLLVIRR
jgi:CelD/BcsL family acetyltransferase involved in cellulose biosynthesis